MLKKIKLSKIRILSIFLLIFCLFSLSSCGNKYGKTTLYLTEVSSTSSCMGSTTTQTKADWLIEKIQNGADASLSSSEQLDLYKDNLTTLILSYANYSAIAKSDDEDTINANYQVCLIKEDINTFLAYIDNITIAEEDSISDITTILNGSAGCFDTTSKKTANKALADVANVNDVYRLGALFLIQADDRLTELEPIKFKGDTAGEFFSHLWNNLFIFPVAWVLYAISKLFGGYYIFGLVITTILLRTIGWPIYSKSNDMTLKMNLMQPELQAIQEKYAGKNDPESQRRMQMEQASLYKKYKIGAGGCLAPFLQFPIFMAIFRAISRLPYTKAIANSKYTLNWANELKPNLFGVNLFEDRNGGGVNQIIGIVILLLLVVGTRILSQVLTQLRQKKNQDKAQEDIPEYRRQAYNQTQNSAHSQMNTMLWVMILMMGMFVWTSKAGLGVYWFIGNIYSMLQMIINNKNSGKKLEKMRNQQGVYTIKSDSNKKVRKK
jgi:YidC/Oxa1 family membrane protein insertase